MRRRGATFRDRSWALNYYTTAAGRTILTETVADDERLAEHLYRHSFYCGRKGARAGRRLGWEVPITSLIYEVVGLNHVLLSECKVRGRFRVFWHQMRICRGLRGGYKYENEWREAHGQS
jgi:hypothetical protein